MKKFILWVLAIIITLSAAVYQRMTGPTYPKRLDVTLNDTIHKLRLVRTLSLNEKSEVRLNLNDVSIKAKLYFKKFKTDEEYQTSDFIYREFPANKNGFFAEVPQQPVAGKIQYYVEITDSKGTRTYLKENPVVIRFKGDVPAGILIPHILLMFIAMLFSTLAGLMSLVKFPLYKIYGIWTLFLFIIGGFILGPIVQYFAFGELWTGIPFGWDLTDNKTLIALLFWILAVVMNRKKDRPVYTAIAAIVLLLVFSIPHSLFGSELNYTTGHITTGLIINFF
jgi:hypothetical protein